MSLELLVIGWFITMIFSASIGVFTGIYAVYKAGIKSTIPSKLRTPCRNSELYIIIPFINIFYSIVFLVKTIRYYRKN